MVFGDWFIDRKKGGSRFSIARDDDVGEAILPEKSSDSASDMPSGISFEVSELGVVFLNCPYDSKDPFLV